MLQKLHVLHCNLEPEFTSHAAVRCGFGCCGGREDGDTEHTRASPHRIYRFIKRQSSLAATIISGDRSKSAGDASVMSAAPVELYPAATPDRSFAAELLEQRYVGLIEGGEAALMSAEWRDAREGMVHPTDEILEEETRSTLVNQERGEEGRGRRWPELASEVLDAVRAFEAEHDARTLRMYMADWADHLIGKVLGVDEVPWFLLGIPLIRVALEF